MITKTLGTIVIIFICILMFPVAFGIIGGLFGIVAGVFGAVIGAIGAVIGGIFSLFGWFFDGLFNWHWPYRFFNCNIFTLAAIVLIIALALRRKQNT
jgi:hypothetical protein